MDSMTDRADKENDLRNPRMRTRFSLSTYGGEGWGEEASFACASDRPATRFAVRGLSPTQVRGEGSPRWRTNTRPQSRWQRSVTLCAAVLLLGPLSVIPCYAAKVRVITTLTDLADFTREVGGEHVDVFSLATGVEDTHGIPMKPSFVPAMNRADLLISVGLGCEHAFLPALLEASRNPRIQPGRPGYIDCSVGVTPLAVPKSTDHSEGDVHPYGNPHYLLDPVLAKTAIGHIYDALAATAPQFQADFQRNRDGYLARLNAKLAEWQQLAKPLKGVKFVSYHEEWEYFADRFGMKVFGTIEVKPGIDPTPRHIEQLIAGMKAEHVAIVVREPQFPEKVPKLIAQQTGAVLVKLPIMPGGVPHTSTYIEMMDYNLHTLADAMKEKGVALR